MEKFRHARGAQFGVCISVWLERCRTVVAPVNILNFAGHLPAR